MYSLYSSVFKSSISQNFSIFREKMGKNVKNFENLSLFGHFMVILRLFSNMKVYLVFKKSTVLCVRLLWKVFIFLINKISNGVPFSEKFWILDSIGHPEIVFHVECFYTKIFSKRRTASLINFQEH